MPKTLRVDGTGTVSSSLVPSSLLLAGSAGVCVIALPFAS
jgi:hypothetical protein